MQVAVVRKGFGGGWYVAAADGAGGGAVCGCEKVSVRIDDVGAEARWASAYVDEMVWARADVSTVVVVVVAVAIERERKG